ALARRQAEFGSRLRGRRRERRLRDLGPGVPERGERGGDARQWEVERLAEGVDGFCRVRFCERLLVDQAANGCAVRERAFVVELLLRDVVLEDLIDEFECRDTVVRVVAVELERPQIGPARLE